MICIWSRRDTCGKSKSESDGFEVQNLNPMDSYFSWLCHISSAYVNLILSLKTGHFGVLPSKSFRLVLKKPNLIQQNHTHNCKPKTL